MYPTIRKRKPACLSKHKTEAPRPKNRDGKAKDPNSKSSPESDKGLDEVLPPKEKVKSWLDEFNEAHDSDGDKLKELYLYDDMASKTEWAFNVMIRVPDRREALI